MKSRTMLVILAIATATAGLPFFPAFASSHREAPGIARLPQVDGTDFYMFRSYEDGRGDFVTIIANYNPLQDPFGGPNYFPLDPNAHYDIHITNDGDAVEDITVRFQVPAVLRNAGFLGIFVGPQNDRVGIPLPLMFGAPFGPEDSTFLTVRRDYYVRVI